MRHVGAFFMSVATPPLAPGSRIAGMLYSSSLQPGLHNMPRNQRVDFFEEIERIEQVLSQLLAAERDAFARMMAAPAGPAKSAALSAYRRAAAAQKKAVDRRQQFLEKNRP